MPKIRFMVVLACMLALFGPAALAQETGTPNFWDQRQRLAKPTLPTLERIRFLTSVDYPPFNFLDARGRLGGFNVDLVRAACEELGLIDRCQIEARPFADLLPALAKGEAEAVIAGVAVTPENRGKLAFTESYFRFAARFVTKSERSLTEPLADTLAAKRVGVIAGGAHAAMLQAYFPLAQAMPFDNRDLALAALRDGRVDAVFGDGVGLAFWLESDAAGNCCSFSGGPYFSERFLGEGLAIAVDKKNADLAKDLDYALGQVVAKRRFSELMLRYFPLSAF